MTERNELGIVKSIEQLPDEDGKIVLQAIVHFYDGNCPAITPGSIWERKPVRIIEVRDAPGERAAQP